jgi:hypothetical protein
MVTVKIFAGGEFFEAIASVLYSGATLGMGLSFHEVKRSTLPLALSSHRSIFVEFFCRAVCARSPPDSALDLVALETDYTAGMKITQKSGFGCFGTYQNASGPPAAVQEGFLGWGNGLDTGFRVATGKTGFAPVLG